MAKREEMWERLGGTVDVLIIGGGINGAGIARDASRRGLKVAMLEMNDLASGTSSASSKLVHGGIRYLEQLEFSLVFESVSERRILLDIAPHLVNPLGFLFPVYKTSRRGLTTINAGMWLYEGLSLFRSPKRHRTLNPKDIAREEPALDISNVKGAPLYYDCSTDDARLTLESAVDASHTGAVISTWTKVTKLLRDKNQRVIGVEAQNVFTGEKKKVFGHAIINATGPWTDRTMSLGGSEATQRAGVLRPTKGVHLVVKREKLPVNNAVVCFHPEDKRVLFAIPWGDHTYVGTTDTDYQGDPGKVRAEREDIDYLLEVSNHHFKEHQLTYDDVISTWAGLRPLVKPLGNEADMDESSVSREHQIIVGNDGLITIAGGKLTTYRKMSKEVVDTAVKLLRLSNQLPGHPLYDANTDREPLPGAQGWPADDDHERVAEQVKEVGGEHLPMESARLLANTYGMRGMDVARLVREDATLAERIDPDRPEIMAQVDFGVHEEFAATVVDVMERRTQLYYRSQDQGYASCEKVGRRMQQLLGWDDARTEDLINAYRARVDFAREWRQG
jgi:glycerol-3-phosphate dehydrogenase